MEKLNIVKIGGSVIENPRKLEQFLKSFASLNQKKILVHGGGSMATKIGNRLGLQEKKVDGRRITDDNFLEVVTMVYGGLINKQIVGILQKLGCNALGLTGADGDYIRARKREKTSEIDFGWVGDPINVRTFFLTKFLKDEIVPVAAPLTHDGNGNILNTNADTIAATLTAALTENYYVDLIYAFELNGVMENLSDKKSLLKNLDMRTYAVLKKEGKILNGMIPKLDNAFAALSKGAKNVKIVKYDSINQLDNLGFKKYTNIQL